MITFLLNFKGWSILNKGLKKCRFKYPGDSVIFIRQADIGIPPVMNSYLTTKIIGYKLTLP